MMQFLHKGDWVEVPESALELVRQAERSKLAVDHDRIVAEAEARGRNAAVEAAINAVRALCNHDDGTECGLDETLDAIAALRKPEVEG